jgi:polyisoprenoid-binding protein YceI
MIFRAIGFLLVMVSNAIASDWTIDAEASTLTFVGTQTGTEFEGKFRQFSGTIYFDAEQLEQSNINITIDTSSARTGTSERDSILPGADWFDVVNHPTASFNSTDVVSVEDGYMATGSLSLKGTEKEIQLPFKLRIEGDTARAVGNVTIDRNDFEIGTGPLGPMVGSDVTIKFSLTATR